MGMSPKIPQMLRAVWGGDNMPTTTETWCSIPFLTQRGTECICLCICKFFPEQRASGFSCLGMCVCMHRILISWGLLPPSVIVLQQRLEGLIYSPMPLAGYCISTGAAVINIFGWRTVSNSVGNTKQSYGFKCHIQVGLFLLEETGNYYGPLSSD